MFRSSPSTTEVWCSSRKFLGLSNLRRFKTFTSHKERLKDIVIQQSYTGHIEEALFTLDHMFLNNLTQGLNIYSPLVYSCIQAWDLKLHQCDIYRLGEQVKTHILKAGFYSGHVTAALITLYNKCGYLEVAYQIFHEKKDADVTCMLLGVCVRYDNMKLGIHAAHMIFKHNAKDASAYVLLSSLYAYGDHFEDVIRVREEMIDKKVVKQPDVKMVLLNDFIEEEIYMDQLEGFISKESEQKMLKDISTQFSMKDMDEAFYILEAWCSSRKFFGLSNLRRFKTFTSHKERLIDIVIQQAYTGHIEEALFTLNHMFLKNLTQSLNTYSRSSTPTFKLGTSNYVNVSSTGWVGLSNLLKLRPDSSRHGGLIHEGARYFVNIYKVHGLKPSMMHHSCIVDMLGRGGYLDEAMEYINSWRLNDPILWRTLLDACVRYDNIKLGIDAAHMIFKHNAKDASAFVLLSGLYAYGDHFEDVIRVREEIDDKKVVKQPGYSWEV
ncbi:UNVERIFIED_CONTAM: Pentatricopeptide repeat-containing protein, mitochondrial [Sesamum radiatum]|uniref:Pentatricopeptide repeat-containing protein, mitochondrial n=1 Tax=Sesamum radiatum TaxID=300843 RepID=A0AAW2L4K4_SESRA